MESLILKTLGFEVSVPTILNFLERFLKATECPVTDSPKVESLAKVSLIVTVHSHVTVLLENFTI